MIRYSHIESFIMCVNFRPPDPDMLDAVMGVIIDLHDTGFWKTETWKDYGAPSYDAAPTANAKA